MNIGKIVLKFFLRLISIVCCAVILFIPCLYFAVSFWFYPFINSFICRMKVPEEYYPIPRYLSNAKRKEGGGRGIYGGGGGGHWGRWGEEEGGERETDLTSYVTIFLVR